MKLSNYIFQKLVDSGYDTVFMVTGGGAMHLNDAVGRIKGINFICNHNEQACSMAAEGYARIKNKPAIVSVTTGPGSINALNGVFGAFTDSIPMIVISGQVKAETMLSKYNIPGLRQLGDQEVEIIPMVKGITKYSCCITDPKSIRFHLEKAIFLATNGRPGPVWLDIPVDIQASDVDEITMEQFVPTNEMMIDNSALKEDVKKVIHLLDRAKRPVFIGSTGIKLANAIEVFDNTLELSGVPVVSAWGHDFIDFNHVQYVGKQGSIGDRAGNFAVQNSDLVIIIGSRMPIRQVSYNWENFARKAYKIQVDIDKAEMSKPTIKIDLPLNYDAKDFLTELNRQLREYQFEKRNFIDWLDWCIVRKNKYPVVQDKHKDPSKPINPYYFISELHKMLGEHDIIACGDATACIVTFQTSQLKKGQHMFSNSGCASMGFDLPSSIGAAVASKNSRVICMAGDGSIQMNIQELQTIVQHSLNIKIIVLDNNGYLSIKSTQNNFFGLSVGSHPDSGVSFPDMEKVGIAYGIPSFNISRFDFQDELNKYIEIPGPVLINVKLDQNQLFEPKLSSKQMSNGKMVSAPLEDMFPFLSEEELKSNMLIDTIKF